MGVITPWFHPMPSRNDRNPEPPALKGLMGRVSRVWRSAMFALLRCLGPEQGHSRPIMIRCRPRPGTRERAGSQQAGTATLITDADSVAHGGQVRIALRLRLADGWHTYWRNPGEAGSPSN
jgi:hypothetical protein